MDQVTFSRNITLELCSKGLRDCKRISDGTLVNDSISLTPVGKAKGGGLHGSSQFQIVEAKTPFKGEIQVNQINNKISIYALLRSGKGTRRHAVTKVIKDANLSDFQSIELIDKPISIDGKLYQAKLLVSPAQK